MTIKKYLCLGYPEAIDLLGHPCRDWTVRKPLAPLSALEYLMESSCCRTRVHACMQEVSYGECY